MGVSRKDRPQIGCSAEQELESQAAITGSSVVKGEGTTRKVRKVRKRKSRAVGKPPIPLLSADKSSFRDLVLHFTGNPSSPSSPPPPPPPLSIHAHAHAHTCTTPPYLSHASPFANDALLNSLLSFINPINSPTKHSLPFGTPMSPLSISPSGNGGHPPCSALSDGSHANNALLFHSSPSPSSSSSSQGATLVIQGENKFSKTLEFLQAVRQLLLLQIKSLVECGSFNFGLLGQINIHDMISNDAHDDDGNDGVHLKPLLRSHLDHTLKSINTYLWECVAQVKSLDVEHMRNLRRAKELESFLLTKDDKLDDLFTI